MCFECSFWSLLVYFSSCFCEQSWSYFGERWWKLCIFTSEWEPQSHVNRSARVTLMKWSWKYRGAVCQAEARRVPKAGPFLLTLLLPLTSLFCLFSSPYLFPPLHSNSPFKSFLPRSSKKLIYAPPPHMCAHPASPPSLFPLLPDYGVDRSGVWEQRAHQFWWGSQLPEVPPHFLHPEPSVPPRRGGLGLSLQSRPEGEIVPDVISHLSSPWIPACDLFYFELYLCVTQIVIRPVVSINIANYLMVESIHSWYGSWWTS